MEEEEEDGHLLARKEREQKLMMKRSEEHGEKEEADGAKGREEHGSGSGMAKQFVLNFTVTISVAVSWALAVQFRRSTLIIDPQHFYAPFSMMWFNAAFMIICYPVFLLYTICTGKKLGHEHRSATKILLGPDVQFNFLHSLLKPMLFVFLFTLINYSYAQSLGMISAGAAASIMSANTALVWVLSWILLREKFSVLKLISVFLAMGGMLVVSLDHQFAGNTMGIVLAIFSTIITAIYKVFFKLLNGNASLGQVSLFMSLLGLLNLVLNAFPMVVLLQLGWDRIEWDYVPWLPLVGSALVGLLFNFLINFGIALLDPLVISIGMLFGMPLSAVIDVVFRALPISTIFIVGSALITASFVLIAFPVEPGFRKVFCRSGDAEQDQKGPEEDTPLQEK